MNHAAALLAALGVVIAVSVGRLAKRRARRARRSAWIINPPKHECDDFIRIAERWLL